MRISIKHGQIILVDDNGDQTEILAALRALDGHALSVQIRSDVCVVLEDLGGRQEACREPINISRHADPRYAAISNLHPTPFILDGEHYGSVEGFWQSLKFDAPAERRRVAALSGPDAKKAGGLAPKSNSIVYVGSTIRIGTHEHWALMEQACTAKFAQYEQARSALLSTGNRPLTHIVRGDSRTIPGVIMSAIWMRIRKRLTAVRPDRLHADTLTIRP